MGGATNAGRGVADGGEGCTGAGATMAAVLRAGSLLAASRARTFSTSHPPPGSCAMRPACAAFCSAVCEMPSRRATSRCEGTSASEAAAIMM
jgi:hypothetical protein